MNRKLIRKSILLALAHFFICIFAGIIGWDWQTCIVSAASIATLFLAHRIMSRKGAVILLPSVPFFLTYTILSLQTGNVLNYPVWVCGIGATLLTFLFIWLKINPRLSFIILSVLIIVEYILVYPNVFSYSTMKKNPERFSLLNANIVDSAGNVIYPENLKGKVYLFDIWHSACLPCIKQFPEIESLYNEYKTDTSVRIVSLNYLLKKDKGVRPARFTEKFSFEKMYFIDDIEKNTFSQEAVPLILIMDKEMKCRFAGTLNTDWNIFIGNVKRIINKLKKENE